MSTAAFSCHADSSHCHCHQAEARILMGCCSFFNISLEIGPPLSIEDTCSHTVRRLTQIPGSTEWVGETRCLLSQCVRGEKRQNMQHFLLFSIFYQCSSYLVYYNILLSAPGWGAVCQSIRPPNGLIQTARSAHGGRGVAVAAVGLHTFALGIQAQVH